MEQRDVEWIATGTFSIVPPLHPTARTYQIGQLQNSLDSKSTEAGALRGYAMVQLFARCWGGILVLLIELNVGLNRLPFACWVETRGEIEKKKTKTQKSQCVRG